MATSRDIRLIDAGDGRRLERFGARLVDRPHPAAVGPPARIPEWRTPDLRFDRDRGWTGAVEPWVVDAEADGRVRMELRATPSGGVGLFPEQLENVDWLEGAVRTRFDEPKPAVLNLFAHTGLLTLAAARAGAEVTHVDGSRPAVAWARRNAGLSGLADAPIRWIVDDAVGFARREGRRGRRYDGFVLDPPSYGHAGRRAFTLESGLAELLEACAAIAARGAFVVLSMHTPEIEPDRLLDELASAFGRAPRFFEAVPLTLESETGATLPLGTAIRSRR